VGSNPAGISWRQLCAEVFNMTALAPIYFPRAEKGVKPVTNLFRLNCCAGGGAMKISRGFGPSNEEI